MTQKYSSVFKPVLIAILLQKSDFTIMLTIVPFSFYLVS